MRSRQDYEEQKKRKKKKREDDLNNLIYQILLKSLEKALNEALIDLFKDF